MKLSQSVTVKNRSGLHTRPATLIVKLLQGMKSRVELHYKCERADARSILAILLLAARKNAVIEVTVEGEDAEETMKKIVEAFESGLGE